MSGRTYLLAWICLFQLSGAATKEFASPTIAEDESVNKHLYAYDDTFIYQEAENVSFWCFPPPYADKGVGLRWNYVAIVKANPTNPSALLSVTISEDSVPIYLTLHYNPKQYVNTVNISCEAYDLHNDKLTASRHMLVEQQYGTSGVVVSEGKALTADPDELVELNCVADGNPSPEYEWESRRGIKRMPLTHQTLYFYQPLGEISLYKCKAKNSLNNDWVDSEWTQITGVPSAQVVQKSRSYKTRDGRPFPNARLPYRPRSRTLSRPRFRSDDEKEGEGDEGKDEGEEGEDKEGEDKEGEDKGEGDEGEESKEEGGGKNATEVTEVNERSEVSEVGTTAEEDASAAPSASGASGTIDIPSPLLLFMSIVMACLQVIG